MEWKRHFWWYIMLNRLEEIAMSQLLTASCISNFREKIIALLGLLVVPIEFMFLAIIFRIKSQSRHLFKWRFFIATNQSHSKRKQECITSVFLLCSFSFFFSLLFYFSVSLFMIVYILFKYFPLLLVPYIWINTLDKYILTIYAYTIWKKPEIDEK